jgi:acetyl-CoA carboxylase biotin carboxylase subunit
MAALIGKILIANRGEIACRIAATCRRLGIATVAVYSEADAQALHVRMCDESMALGPAEAAQSYLLTEKLIEAAEATGAQAIHPGYGFLSESAKLAQACAKAGLVFIGPEPQAIALMGSKLESRRLAKRAGVPCLPGYDDADQSDAALAAAADWIGYPLIIKASAGGGGKGIRVVAQAAAFLPALGLVRREARAAFGDDHVVLEKYVPAGRHIEVQVVGDAEGNIVHLFDRECSLQRRHQKLIEEAPAPGLPEDKRQAMHEVAVRLARAIGYRSLGTVEFLWDVAADDFHFLEMNTRIQVEHPVTEMVTGLDLVELQIRIAEGRPLPFAQGDVRIAGHAIEARINAEEPAHDFRPSTGAIDRLDVPRGPGIRFDTGVSAGSTVSPYYDSMIAKLIVAGEDRERARAGLIAALDGLAVGGIATNVGYLREVLAHPDVAAGRATTAWLDGFKPWAEELGDRQLLNFLAAVALDHAVGIEEARSAELGDDPWGSLGGWRLLDKAGHGARLPVGIEDQAGRRHRVVVEGRKGRYKVAVGANPAVPVAARRTAEGLVMQAGRHGRTVPVKADGAQVHVRIGDVGRSFRIVAPEEAGAATVAAAHAGDIVAPLPGMVAEILARVGDRVEVGQPFIVIEAMKMMHGLSAPGAGVIAEICCRPGEAIEMGRTLARMAGEAVRQEGQEQP